MKTKKQLLKEEYMRNRRRIQKFLQRQRKAGVDTSGFEMPAIPKRITQGSINRLEKLTPKVLKEKIKKPKQEKIKLPEPEKSEYEPSDIETRDIIDVLREAERKPKKTPQDLGLDKTTDAQIVINNFKDQVMQIPERWHSVLLEFLDEAIRHTSEEDVAEALDKMPRRVRDFLSRWGSEFDFIGFSSEFIQYLPITDGQKSFMEDVAEEIWHNDLYNLKE